MAGIVTGENILVDRYPYGDAEKVLPVTTEQIKDHVQVAGNFDDDLIAGIKGYVAAATDEVELRCQMALVAQRRVQYISQSDLPYLAGSTIELTVGPVLAITAVRYLDANEVAQTLPTTAYRRPPHTNAIYFKSMPAIADGPNTVWVEYEAGYGTSNGAVPALAVQLVCILAAHHYDHRSGDGTNQVAAWERMVRVLVRTLGDSSHRIP